MVNNHEIKLNFVPETEGEDVMGRIFQMLQAVELPQLLALNENEVALESILAWLVEENKLAIEKGVAVFTMEELEALLVQVRERAESGVQNHSLYEQYKAKKRQQYPEKSA